MWKAGSLALTSSIVSIVSAVSAVSTTGQVLHSQAPAQVVAPLELEHLAHVRAHVRAQERDHLRQARRALRVLEALQAPVLA